MVLIAATPADTDCAYYFASRFSGMPPAKIMILPSIDA
jgi:hypothetical protein